MEQKVTTKKVLFTSFAVDLDVYMSSHLGTKELEVMMDKIKDSIREKVSSAKFIQVELETPRRD